MPKPKSPSSDPEAKGAEQQQPPPEIEEAAPSPEAGVEEPPDETPSADPFEGRTTEDILKSLQEHRQDDFGAFTQEHWEKGRRQGQGEGTKQFKAEREKWEQEEKDTRTFDHFAAMRDSDDLDQSEQYAKAMRDPKIKDSYDRGEKLRKGPDATEVVANGINQAMTSVYQPLRDHPHLKGMTQEEHNALYEEFRGKPEPFTQLVQRYCELIVEKGTAAGGIQDTDKKIRDATEAGRREAYDEMGVQYPASEITGGAPRGRLPTKDELDGMTQEEINELERQGKLDKILAGRK